jgi:hypothetical protein
MSTLVTNELFAQPGRGDDVASLLLEKVNTVSGAAWSPPSVWHCATSCTQACLGSAPENEYSAAP